MVPWKRRSTFHAVWPWRHRMTRRPRPPSSRPRTAACRPRRMPRPAVTAALRAARRRPPRVLELGVLGALAAGGLGVGGQVELGAVLPEPLQGVEDPLLAVLDVDDDVDVVEQDPAGVAVALAAHRLGAELLVQPLLDLVDDRLDLAVVGRGGQQEGVRDRQHVADVVRDDVVRELVGGRLRGGGDELDRAVSGGHYKAFGRRSGPRGATQGSHGPPTAPHVDQPRTAREAAPGPDRCHAGPVSVGPGARTARSPSTADAPTLVVLAEDDRHVRVRGVLALLHRARRQAQRLGDLHRVRLLRRRRRM